MSESETDLSQAEITEMFGGELLPSSATGQRSVC